VIGDRDRGAATLATMVITIMVRAISPRPSLPDRIAAASTTVHAAGPRSGHCRQDTQPRRPRP
jgi:hypothetical protein